MSNWLPHFPEKCKEGKTEKNQRLKISMHAPIHPPVFAKGCPQQNDAGQWSYE
jgi:hypothetical protein